MLNDITKKEFAQMCYDTPDMQKFIEGRCFEIVKLDDGYLSVDKSSIEKNFCFGYGMYGVDWDGKDQERASKCEEASRCFDYFHERNTKELKETISRLKAALKANGDMFESSHNRLAVIAIHNAYSDERNDIKDWSCLDTRHVLGEITKEGILESYKKYDRVEYRLATVEEIKSILGAYERELEHFEKRLKTWWKKYGAEGLRTWTYLVD